LKDKNQTEKSDGQLQPLVRCHRWNGNSKKAPLGTSNKGGLAVACIYCGCVKEYVNGIPTYFIDDTVYDRYAPKCDRRLVSA